MCSCCSCAGTLPCMPGFPRPIGDQSAMGSASKIDTASEEFSNSCIRLNLENQSFKPTATDRAVAFSVHGKPSANLRSWGATCS